MSDNIVIWKGVTFHDLPPDRLLEAAKGHLDSVVILGWDKDGDIYFASSKADGGEVMWLIEFAKRALMENS